MAFREASGPPRKGDVVQNPLAGGRETIESIVDIHAATMLLAASMLS